MLRCDDVSTAKPQVIFHFPRPIEGSPTVGSDVHVRNLLEGMRAVADVEVVDGYSADRVRLMRRLSRQMRGGRHFDALFSEASTTPTALNNPNHLPRHVLSDALFFRRATVSGARVGLFYPDVYWRFEYYRSMVSAPVRLLTTAAYRFDLAWYSKYVDLLFLPSLEMSPYIPGWGQDPRVRALPPGLIPDPEPWLPKLGRLRLLYVGGVVPPVYDVSSLLDAVVESRDVDLLLCCPADQRHHLAAYERAPNIDIVHESGEQLRRRYAATDIACLVFADDPYRRFAMPVKLFEALGAGRPIIASSPTTAADFVLANDVGWVVQPDTPTLVGLLHRLIDAPHEVDMKHEVTITIASKNTWAHRATEVLTELGVDVSTSTRR